MRPPVLVLSTCLWACGDNGMAPPDMPDAKPFHPAPHAPMPRVLRHSGTVLENLQLVTFRFENYPGAQVDRFADAVVESEWYASVGAEYGIGPGTHVAGVTLGPAPGSLTRDQIAMLITLQLTNNVAVPKPTLIDNELVYLIYIPPAVTRGPDLEGTVAYHQTVTFAGATFPIVVVLDDGRGPEALTVAAARQLIDTAANPYDSPNDGYYADAPMIDPWSLVHGEVADLCEGETPVMEAGFALPRVYSDAAVQAGNSPCGPSVPDDSWSDVSADPSTVRMIRRGESVTFELTGWSTTELPDWSLRTRVADFSDLTEAQMRPELSDDRINNNTTVELTLHAPVTAPLGAAGGVYVLSGANLRPWAVGFVVR